MYKREHLFLPKDVFFLVVLWKALYGPLGLVVNYCQVFTVWMVGEDTRDLSETQCVARLRKHYLGTGRKGLLQMLGHPRDLRTRDDFSCERPERTRRKGES